MSYRKHVQYVMARIVYAFYAQTIYYRDRCHPLCISMIDTYHFGVFRVKFNTLKFKNKNYSNILREKHPSIVCMLAQAKPLPEVIIIKINNDNNELINHSIYIYIYVLHNLTQISFKHIKKHIILPVNKNTYIFYT